jgi:hypothetical protein
MNSEYAVGNIRIHFESRVRRRWFVTLCYAVFAIADLVLNFLGPKLNQGIDLNLKAATGAWIICVSGVLFVALLSVLTWLAGDMRARGDERETHRRDHAHYVSYYSLGYGLIAALFAAYFRGPNPVTPLLPLGLREFLIQLPNIMLVATGILYITLPQAILLWTEPDLEEAR